MIIGYTFGGANHPADMFSKKYGTFDQCPTCKKFNTYNLKLGKLKTPYDFSATSELCPIASKKFKAFCEDNGYGEVKFIPFEKSSDYFIPEIKNIVKMDQRYRPLEYGVKPCPTCKRYKDHPAILPLFLKDDAKPLEDGFYRTDFETGIYFERPIFIIAPATFEKMSTQGFKGFSFTPIYQKSDFKKWTDAPVTFLKFKKTA